MTVFIETSEFVATLEKRTGLMIGCLEEIAYSNGWISKEQLKRHSKGTEEHRLWRVPSGSDK